MKRLRRPILGMIVSISLLLLAEGVLRIQGVRPAYRPEELPQWRMSANLDNASLHGPVGHAFRVSTNADGLRTHLTRTKPRRRIALLGDSVVFGWGVDDGESFPDAVAAALPEVDILNAGQPGYSSTMTAWLYQTVILDYQPDEVILFHTLNDYGKVLVSDREALSGTATLWAAIRVFLARESRIYEVIRGMLFRNTG